MSIRLFAWFMKTRKRGRSDSDCLLFSRPADYLGIHHFLMRFQFHLFVQLLSVYQAEDYSAEPGGRAVEIHVLTYVCGISTGYKPFAVFAFCKIALHFGEVGYINQPDRGRVHHLLGSDGGADIPAVDLQKLVPGFVVEIEAVFQGKVYFDFL